MKGLGLALLLLISFSSFSQTESLLRQAQDGPYKFNWKSDLVASTGAGVLMAGGFFATGRLRPLTEAQVNALDSFELSGIDRTAITKWNPTAATVSDIFLYTSFALPGLMMLNKRARKDVLVLGFMYVEVAMLTIGLTEVTKAATHRVRPYAYNTDVDFDFRTTSGARQSFFSGHTASTAALCFLTAKVFSDYSDNPTHEALVWTGAALFPVITASLRYASGRHYPSDLIAGYAIGATIGYLIPWLHRRKPIVKGMSLMPYSGGKNELGVYFSYRL